MVTGDCETALVATLQLFNRLKSIPFEKMSHIAQEPHTLMMHLPRSITATALLGAMSQLYDVVLFC